jgi:hypothetical protein
VWGEQLSRERDNATEAEAVHPAEGNMCGTAMRGAVARSWSKTLSRTKGTCWNLGGLVSDRTDAGPFGPRREGEEPKPTMHGHEKSDPAIVAMKPANGAGKPGMEWVERRAGAEGNADQQSMHRAQNRGRVSQALERVRYCRWDTMCTTVTYPRWEPYAGKPHVRFCAGGAQ